MADPHGESLRRHPRPFPQPATCLPVNRPQQLSTMWPPLFSSGTLRVLPGTCHNGPRASHLYSLSRSPISLPPTSISATAPAAFLRALPHAIHHVTLLCPRLASNLLPLGTGSRHVPLLPPGTRHHGTLNAGDRSVFVRLFSFLHAVTTSHFDRTSQFISSSFVARITFFRHVFRECGAPKPNHHFFCM